MNFVMESNNEKIKNIIRESLSQQRILFLNEDESNRQDFINLYQSTTIERLEGLKKNPMFSFEYFGSVGGNLHTRAVYANLNIEQAFKLKYGPVLVKLNFYGGLKNVLCINKYVAGKFYDGKNIIEQLKDFPELYNLLNDYIKNILIQAFYSGENESGAILNLCNYLGNIERQHMAQNGLSTKQIAHKSTGDAERQDFSHAILSKYGIRGFIYWGRNDHMCVIPLNADEVVPVSYAIHPRDIHNIQWHRFNVRYDPNKVNHIQAFMAQFGDKYIWDRNERSYLDTILVQSREDNLFYFLDTKNNGKLLFDVGFFNARQFDPTTKKAWVQITKDDSGLFIDRKGTLYRTSRGRPYTELRFYIQSDDDMNIPDTDTTGFSFDGFDLS